MSATSATRGFSALRSGLRTRAELPADLVVDASVVLRRLLQRSPAAGAVLRREPLAAPTTIVLEVLNGLTMQVRFGGGSRAIATAFFEEFRELEIDLIPTEALAQDTIALADELGLTAYEASYVALASRLGAPLATADRRLAARYDRAELIA